MSKTSGSKHCRPRCWTISVCAAPSSRPRRGQKRRGFAGAPTAITSAWQRGTSSRSAPTAWSALPWATRPRPCRPGGAARGRCSAPIRSPRSSRVATDLVTALTGARNARMEILLSIILQDEITRLTGYRRHDLAHRAGQEGLKVSEVTMQKLGKSLPKGSILPPGWGDCYIRTTLGQQCVEASSIWWRVQ